MDQSTKPLSQKIVAIIQARMTSSRLPGKVLRNIGGSPMLGWVVERTRRATLVDEVIVATTIHPSDDPVAEFCQDAGYAVYRGSLQDVLDRYYQAGSITQADVVVRITADCPFIDPELIDQTIRAFYVHKVDFTTNRLPPPWGRSYPIGLDTEVCSFDVLARVWREANLPYHREHVMPYIYEDAPVDEFQMIAGLGKLWLTPPPKGFKVLLLEHEPDYGDLRWTVDTPADLQLAQQIAQAFSGRDDFSWLEILELLRRNPGLAEINASVQHKGYQDIDTRFREDEVRGK